MTKEQKLDIERWIYLQILKLDTELDTWYLDTEEEAITKARRDVYSEVKLLMEGALIVSDDYTELRPA